ncbi:nadD [Symbiodinium sp. CCMP2456]|nr:nadD [Symbiodinium sp. CCMP2456]
MKSLMREKLETTPLEVKRVLRSFGQPADDCSVTLLLTENGMPKYIIELKDGTRLFMGSVFGDSKDSDNVLASMWTLVPCFEEKQCLASDKHTPMSECSYKLPATLGALHTAFRASGVSIEGLKYYSAVASFDAARANLQNCMASTSAMPSDLRPVLRPVEQCLRQLREADVAVLDALPRQVIHGDFQPKNLMLSPDGSLRICDTETMTQGPRIYDLLFVFMGSDDGDLLGHWGAALDRLEEYLVASWPLDEDELQAMPTALAHLATGIAAWAAQKFENPGSLSPERLMQIITCFSQAAKEFSDSERITACCRLANCFAGGPAVELEAYCTYFHRTEELGMGFQCPALETGEKRAAVFFNGTFSPVHAGHLATAESAVKELGFDKVTVVFSPCHDSHEGGKLKQLSVGVKHRAAMLEVAGATVDLYEAYRDTAAMDLEGVQSSFVRRLPANYDAFFLVGADVASWRWLRRKVALGLFVLLVANRPGSESRVEACERSF